MESTVALELFRRTCLDPGLSLFYWSKQGSGEVDFVLRRGGGTESLVQCCFDAADDDTRRRELRSLSSDGDMGRDGDRDRQRDGRPHRDPVGVAPGESGLVHFRGKLYNIVSLPTERLVPRWPGLS